ncbi:ABC transporter ATP-binding protein [Phycisphaerae bacterium]|jgi:ABC-2 type transport system ATP-binding protein|nr:ABC transporter ATP-binding protein [Phycisphaerae bacterium]
MSAIQLTNLTKTFGTKLAVDNLNFAVEEGSLIGLIGPNGAGKTTTIRMIMSIIFPDSGQISVLGKASAGESKDLIGYLPEERGVYKKMKVGAFLTYIARLKNVPESEVSRRVNGWLERVALADTAKKRCEELSKGMQQKVQFIASVIHQPRLVILDEPFSGLDPVNSRLLRSLVHDLHTQGTTIIFSTHQMSQAEALCDRIVMIHQGKKVLDDTPSRIRNQFDPRAVFIEPVDAIPEQALAALPGVDRVREVGGGFEVFAKDSEPASTMLARLAAAVPATRLEVVRPSLEDVFIDIVKGSASSDEELAELEALARGSRSDTSGD